MDHICVYICVCVCVNMNMNLTVMHANDKKELCVSLAFNKEKHSLLLVLQYQ